MSEPLFGFPAENDSPEHRQLFQEMYEKAIDPIPQFSRFSAKIPKRVHQIWIGPEKPYVKRSKERWTKYCSKYLLEYVFWDERLLNKYSYTSSILKICKEKNIDLAHISDVLRYTIVKLWGGLYVDVDFVPNQNKDIFGDILDDSSFAVVTEHWANPGQYGGIQCANGIFASASYHPLITRIADRAIKNLKTMKATLWTVGPYYFTASLYGSFTTIHHSLVMVSYKDTRNIRKAYLYNIGD
jgi:mannosyltransferase OCH1-like enzyme